MVYHTGVEPTPATIIESLALELMMKGVIDDTLIEQTAALLAQRPAGGLAAQELRYIALNQGDVLSVISSLQSLADRMRPSLLCLSQYHAASSRAMSKCSTCAWIKCAAMPGMMAAKAPSVTTATRSIR